MSEFKSFSVIINLHHFLNDHRSISRIFINKRLKSIGDLHNHVANIYNITNFYFVCNNQYLPCSEDIRVLQSEDTVIAFPDKSVCDNKIITDTSCANQVVTTTVKNNKCLLENMDDDFNVATLVVKTKKNRKRKLEDEPYKLNEVCTVDAQQLTKQQKKKLQKMTEEVNSKECSENKKPKKKRKNENHSVLPDLQKLSVLKRNCVKDKVSYFEEHSKSNENLQDDFPTNSSVHVSKIVTSESNTYLESKKAAKVVSRNDFKNRSILVTRRNDVISFDLPKETNVVKNVIVSPQFHKQIGPTVDKNLHKDINVVENLVRTPQLHKQIDNNIKENLFKENNFPKNLVVTPQLPKRINTNVKEIELANMMENLVNLKNSTNVVEKSQHVFESSKNCNGKDESNKGTSMVRSDCIGNENQILGDVKRSTYDDTVKFTGDMKHSCQDNVKPEMKNAMPEVNPKKISRYSVEIIHDQTAANASKPPASVTSPRLPKPIDHSCDVIGVLTEGEHVPHNKETSWDLLKSDADLSMETAPSFINSVDSTHVGQQDSDFVTKRKRRRSHRKRKSTIEPFPASMLPVTSTPLEYHYPKMQTVPSIHIKFDENCEPAILGNGKNGGDKLTKEIVDIKHETPMVIDEYDDILDVPSDAQNIEDDVSKYGEECKVSDSVILSAPLMDKISPKIGDLIAFKILRMSEDYTPELSSFIVAKVVGFHEATNEITVYVIDGADQFVEPQGKFAVPLENDAPSSNVKNVSWSDFIEPRLLFP